VQNFALLSLCLLGISANRESIEKAKGDAQVTAQIKSRTRVVDHGEVFTAEREVKAMLDLVKNETERIESRFLEPACGTGNFLIEVLRRKLERVCTQYAKSQYDFEHNALIAIGSLYGIDLLEDNVLQCRERLYAYFHSVYTPLFTTKCREECLASIHYVLQRNIIWGDALTFVAANATQAPIIFSEWSAVQGGLVKRRDFRFEKLVKKQAFFDLMESDTADDVFIPYPDKEYPPAHFLTLALQG
jgi:hypothetical protein